MAAPLPSGMRGGDVVGVGGGAVAEQLRHRSLAPRFLACSNSSRTRMPAPFAQDEAVAVLVEGPAGLLRLVVALREAPGGDEAGQAHRRDGRLGAAGDHDVGYRRAG